jgi:hypothetical protein
MTDQELIIKSKTAWHDNKTKHFNLPIYSTDGTHLIDITFKREGDDWVGLMSHAGMIELVKFADALRRL